MFREESLFDAASVSFGDWRVATTPASAAQPSIAHASSLAAAFAEEETGAVADLYREIARRVPRNAFTPHASTLGETLG